MGQQQSKKGRRKTASPAGRGPVVTVPAGSSSTTVPRRASGSAESERRAVATASLDQYIHAHAGAPAAPGYIHHLFLIGSGLSLPVGQEPYASFNVTKVKAPLQKQQQQQGQQQTPPPSPLQPPHQAPSGWTSNHLVSTSGAGSRFISRQTQACLDFFDSMGRHPTPMAARPAGTPPPVPRYRMTPRQSHGTTTAQQGSGGMTMSPVLNSSGSVQPAAGAAPAVQATTAAAPVTLARTPSTAATLEDTLATAPSAPAPPASPSTQQSSGSARTPAPAPASLRPGSPAAAVNDAMAAAVERHPWCTATVIVSAFESMQIGRSASAASYGSQHASLATHSQGLLHGSQELLVQQQGVRGASPCGWDRDRRSSGVGSGAAAVTGAGVGTATAGAGAFDLTPHQLGNPPLAATSTGVSDCSPHPSGHLLDSNPCNSQPNNAYLVDGALAAGDGDALVGDLSGASSLPGGGSTGMPILGLSSAGWPVATASVLAPDVVLGTLKELREVDPSLFLILWHPAATEDAALRAAAFAAGANMVTFCERDLSVALTRVVGQAGTGGVTCEYCGLEHLTPADYWMHLPLYHTYEHNLSGTCQVCGSSVPNLSVHVHEMHGPGGPQPEVRTGVGAVVVVHRQADNKFLMVQEFAGQGFWTPGGGTDAGERLSVSAAREVLEEAGVEVEIQGVLQLEYDPDWKPLPWRFVVMYGVAKPGPYGAPQVPKTVPDFESAGACWVPASLLPRLPLRNPWVPTKWYPRVSQGEFEVLPLVIPDEFKEAFKDLAM